MNQLIHPQRLNALLAENNLPALDPGQIEVLFGSIPRQYAQSLLAGLQQHDQTAIAQFRNWGRTLHLHARILPIISNRVALSDVYAACKQQGPKVINDLLTSAEAQDRNAINFLTEHLREGNRAVQQQGLPALLGLGGAPSNGGQERQPARQAGNGIDSMPPPQDDAPATRPAPPQDRTPAPRPAQQGYQGGQGSRQEPPPRQHSNAPRPQSNEARNYAERRVVNHPTRERQADGAERAPRTPTKSNYDQKACYGRDTALQFERCVNKEGDNYTVNLAIAKATGSSSRGGMNWNDKIIMMLTPKEVQLILAVLRGFVPSVRFAGHGQGNDKWIEVKETEDQYAGAIRFTIARGDDRRSVNVGPDDVGEVMSLFFRTAKDQLKQDDGLLLDLAIRRTADLYQKQQANKPQRPQNQGGGGQQRFASNRRSG